MRRASLLTAAAFAAAVPLPPLAATAQTQNCPDAIKAVEQQLQQVKQSENWNRVQVQLYIAEHLLAEGQPQGCLGAVREAQAILGTKTQTAGQAGQDTVQKDKDTNPAGANITGMDTEGWGTHEAKSGAFQEQTGQEQTGPARVPASDIIGKTAQISTGEPIGKIVGTTEGTAGPDRFVIDLGDAKVAVSPSAMVYDEANDAVVVDITEAQLEDAIAASGGEGPVETGTATEQ